MNHCPDCGETGDHPYLGHHYWACGSLKRGSMRGEACYERELARKDSWIGKAKSILSTVACSTGVIILSMFASKAQALLTEMGAEDEVAS